jgi:hypothetical protein
MEGGEGPAFRWASLTPLVHHAKIAIVEALLYTETPLSPTQLVRLFGDEKTYYLSLVAYHARALEAAGVIEEVETRRGRAPEHFYAICDDLLRR